MTKQELRPDTEAAVAFLQEWHPEENWHICFMQPDGGAFKCKTFDPKEAEECAQFIAARQGEGYNIYFNLNPWNVRDRKAKDADVPHVVGLGLDLDPIGQLDVDFQPNAIGAVADLSATVVMSSGRGVWGLIRLQDPTTDLETARASGNALKEKLNARQNRLYKADNVSDPSRIVRLPGTVNFPSAKKIEQNGAVPTVAGILPGGTRKAIKLEELKPIASPPERCTRQVKIGSARFHSSDDELRDLLASLPCDEAKQNDLYLAATDRTLLDEITSQELQDGSRNSVMFSFLCKAVWAGMKPEDMLGLITDPAWPLLSNHVLEKGKDVDRYARRQVEDAFRRQFERGWRPSDRKGNADIAEVKPASASKGCAIEFKLNKDGLPYPCQHNIRVALHKLGARLSYDKFADRLMIEGFEGHGPTLQDDAVTALYLETDEQFGFRPGKDFFWMVVENEARRRGFHPVNDYLDGLSWDGNPRLDTWLIDYGNAADTSYTRAVGSLLLVAAVKRVYEPGCKFDEMLVLRSAQGTNKSSALAALCPESSWFTDDMPLNADTKVTIERLQGRWIVEAAELKGMRQGEVEHLKAFLSRQIDRARMAYGRLIKEVPRQCVIVGTTNSERFLKDATGNRRFWPVEVRNFDVERLHCDRDQLWAEARQRALSGESIRLDPALYADAMEAQEEHRIEDPFLGLLASVLKDLEGKLRALDAWEIIAVPPGQRTQYHNERLGEAMRELGWKRTKRRFGGSSEWCYVRGEGLKQIIIKRETDGEITAQLEGYGTPF